MEFLSISFVLPVGIVYISFTERSESDSFFFYLVNIIIVRFSLNSYIYFVVVVRRVSFFSAVVPFRFFFRCHLSLRGLFSFDFSSIQPVWFIVSTSQQQCKQSISMVWSSRMQDDNEKSIWFSCHFCTSFHAHTLYAVCDVIFKCETECVEAFGREEICQRIKEKQENIQTAFRYVSVCVSFGISFYWESDLRVFLAHSSLYYHKIFMFRLKFIFCWFPVHLLYICWKSSPATNNNNNSRAVKEIEHFHIYMDVTFHFYLIVCSLNTWLSSNQILGMAALFCNLNRNSRVNVNVICVCVCDDWWQLCSHENPTLHTSSAHFFFEYHSHTLLFARTQSHSLLMVMKSILPLKRFETVLISNIKLLSFHFVWP